MKASKIKKCSVCKTPFEPRTSFQTACSPECAIELARKAKAKREAIAKAEARAKSKAMRERLETIPELTKKAQALFNRYIRLRDKGLPCISCGAPNHGLANSFDAGHYRSVGAAPHLRFVENNCHAQCKKCNQHLSGNVVAYRKGLIERIGLKAVEALEADQTPRRYRKEELRDLISIYRAKAKEIERHG